MLLLGKLSYIIGAPWHNQDRAWVFGVGEWIACLGSSSSKTSLIILFAVRRLPHDLTVEAAVSHGVLLEMFMLDTLGFPVH